MTKIGKLTCLAVAAAILIAAAEPAAADDPAVAQRQIRLALDGFFDAAAEADWQRIEGILTPEFAFYTDDALILSRAEFVEAMKGDRMEIGRLELNDVDIALSGDGKMALVRYRANLESMVKGSPYNMRSVETVVFEQRDGDWKMVHNHASVKPLE